MLEFWMFDEPSLEFSIVITVDIYYWYKCDYYKKVQVIAAIGWSKCR